MQKIIKNPLFWIFVLAILLRIYKLGTFPFGFHVDEVRVGWNALSILKTGLDDHGKFLAPYYNSFGDYRPTGIFYFTIPSIFTFGINEFAVRFPSALFGALTIIPVYLIATQLSKKRGVGLIASFLLTISPWHIEVSRATSEVVISTFFVLFAIYFLISYIKNGIQKYVIFSIVAITIAYLLYHSIRMLAPLLFLSVIAYYIKEINEKQVKKMVFFAFAATAILTLIFSLGGGGKERLKQVSVLGDTDTIYEVERIGIEKTSGILRRVFDNKYVVYGRRFVNEYSTYFSGGFLLGNHARPFRYTTPGIGLLTYIEYALLIYGLIRIFRKEKPSLPLILLLLAPLPAAITTEDTPNLHRAFLMLPFIILIESYGLEGLIDSFKKYKEIIIFSILSLLALNFIFFEYMYFNHSLSHKPFLKDISVDSPTYRNIGAKELALKIDNLSEKYDKVFITNFPDNVYPWYSFFTKKNPKDFNKFVVAEKNGEITVGNIIFSNMRCPSDNAFTNYPKENILVIDSWECPYESKIRDGLPIRVTEKILRPDRSEVYILLERIKD